jgi:hypothetical protein
MRDRLYPDWKLRHFIACFVHLFDYRSNVLSQWKAAIGVAIPRLQTLIVERY